MGLEMLSIFMGVDLTGKIMLNGAYRLIARGAGLDIGKLAAEQAAEKGMEEGSGLFIDNAMMNTLLAEAIEQGTKSAIALATVEFIADSVSVILLIQAIVMLIGMILDAWDPHGFNKMLTGDDLTQMSNTFNAEFENIVLSSMVRTKGAFGNPITMSQWPIEYYADNFLGGENGSHDDKYWINRRVSHILDYTFALKMNSNGYDIIWPKGNQIGQKSFDTIGDSIAMVMSDGNSVVGHWLAKYWIAILIILVAILIFILFLR
jgi:hypothetical protein